MGGIARYGHVHGFGIDKFRDVAFCQEGLVGGGDSRYGGIKVFGLVGYGNEGVFADMERADDMVEVVVGADILVFAIDLLASGIKDLEGNTCDARLRGGGRARGRWLSSRG